jgi:hypothetical protein
VLRRTLSGLMVLALCSLSPAYAQSPKQANGFRAPGPYEPYESYAWDLVKWNLDRMWSDAFTNTPCKGARLTGIANVTFEQVRGFRPNAGAEHVQITEADRLNGVAYRIRYYITAEASRVFDRGHWTPWAPGFEDMMQIVGAPKIGYFIELKNGQWSATLIGTNMTIQRSALPCTQMPQ